MELLSLYDHTELWNIPYQLLQEREPYQSISHRAMPTWEEHCAYVRSKPHLAWYAFKSSADFTAGCVYLSKHREIGIGVLHAHRGQGLAKEAVQAIMAKHPGRFLANVTLANSVSRQLFYSLGFRLLSQTYILES